MSAKNNIKQLAQEAFAKMQSIRRHLHQNPELSFEEHKTMEYVAQQLVELDIPFEKNVAGTGVIGWILGKYSKNDQMVGLRADLDALPIQEQTGATYSSKVAGVMHACGHDVHTAVLLGTAKVLKQMEEDLKQPVLLVFQPGEEKAPGGASLLIEDGLFQKWNISHMLALHVYPELEAGKVGFRKGLYMASCDEIHIEIIGKGGHAAMPHTCIDVVQTGAELVRNLPLLMHRQCDPKIPMVLSFGVFEALGATNVLPDSAKIKGTFRTMNEQWRANALSKIMDYCESLEKSTGAKVLLNIVKGYPFLENNEQLTDEVMQIAKNQLEIENVVDLPIRLTAEDFAFYTHQVPCCFFRLGVRNEEKGIVNSVHHPQFDIEERAMITGIEVFASAVLK